jgi:hypothetical protein
MRLQPFSLWWFWEMNVSWRINKLRCGKLPC